MEQAEIEYYNLIATIGRTPAVVTEVIWKLAVNQKQPRIPESITLITTYPGMQTWSKHMDEGGVWAQFCREILGGVSIKPNFLPLTNASGMMLKDINTKQDDKVLSVACFDLVLRFTEDDRLPLIASVAGGRKTMSSHLQSAVSRHGRRQDRLVHVLVDRNLEGRPDFFYPRTREDSDEVLCVDIEFFPLRAFLEHDVLHDPPLAKRDRNTFVKALKRFEFKDPQSVSIYVGQHRYYASPVQFLDQVGKSQVAGQLSPQNLATLLVLAQQLHEHGGAVTIEQLITPEARKRYTMASSLSDKVHKFSPWEDAQDVRGAVHRLNKEISTLVKNPPVASAYLGIHHERAGESTRYTWQLTNTKADNIPHLKIYCLPGTRARVPNWDSLFPDFPLNHNPLGAE